MTSGSQLFLAPCSREHKDETYENFERSVLNGVSPVDHPEIATTGFSEVVSVWGVVSGNQSTWERLNPGDVILFYTKSKTYTHLAEVIATEENQRLGESLWETYDGNRLVNNLDEPWPYVIYLSNIQRVSIPSPDLHNELGYSTFYPQSFMRPADERQEQIIKIYGSLHEFLDEFAKVNLSTSVRTIEEEIAALERVVTDEPILHDTNVYTDTEQQVRMAAFTRKVRDLYNGSCCICGASRHTPDGVPEVETTHIYPRTRNGRTDLRNGLALCKLHRWAFDTGWISIRDDHTILVQDAPGIRGYEEFSRLEGHTIALPNKTEYHPHPEYLNAHREIHGFDTT